MSIPKDSSLSSWTKRALVCNLLLGAALCAVPVGCTLLPKNVPPVADIATDRLARREAMVQEYEEARTTAQYEAALAKWQQGDDLGAIAYLREIAARNPQWPPAQRLLAEILIAKNEQPEAESILRNLVHTQPTWQDALSLGMLLDSEGRESEAACYFDLAYDIAPEASAAEVLALLDPEGSRVE